MLYHHKISITILSSPQPKQVLASQYSWQKNKPDVILLSPIGRPAVPLSPGRAVIYGNAHIMCLWPRQNYPLGTEFSRWECRAEKTRWVRQTSGGKGHFSLIMALNYWYQLGAWDSGQKQLFSFYLNIYQKYERSCLSLHFLLCFYGIFKVMTINTDKIYIKHQIKWKAFIYIFFNLCFFLFIDFGDI